MPKRRAAASVGPRRQVCRRGGLLYDIKKDVPPWGLVYDIKKDVFPPDPAYTLWCFGEERPVHLTHVCG